MKIEWQAEDIKPGRVVGKPDRSERWMIGYIAAEESAHRFVLISLIDGMVQPPTTADMMAVDLNKAGEMPAEFFSDPNHVKRGQKGGAARAASLSPERRSEIAARAAQARWNGKL